MHQVKPTFSAPVATGSVTQDFVCQTCGKRITLAPANFAVLIGIAMGTMLTCIGPFLVGAYWWSKRQMYEKYPVVGTADRSYLMPQAVRRCGQCGQAIAPNIVHERTNGIPTGTEFRYACACGNRFITNDALTYCLYGLAGVLFTALGFALPLFLCAGIPALFAAIGLPMRQWFVHHRNPLL